MQNDKIHVLMCCSELTVKGGMVSVVKNYLGYNNWGKYEIHFIPTHTEKNKIIVAVYFAFAYLRILFLCCTKKISIAHLHTAERGSFFRKAILVRTLRKFGIKTILHHHAAEFEEFYAGLSKGKKDYVNRTLELADLNIVLSKRLINMILEKAPNAKVEVLYNAVPTYERIPRNPDARNVLFLGRLGRRKGTYDLFDAMKLIDNAIPKTVKFYLCGDGDIDGVKRKIEQLGLQERILHIGWIGPEEKKRIYNDISINVLPSYNEGLPMSILETMAYGIPSLTTAIASIPEVVFDGVNGFLVEPGDVEAIAKKLKTLICETELCHRLGENAYELITNEFGLKSHIEKLMDMYSSLLGE